MLQAPKSAPLARVSLPGILSQNAQIGKLGFEAKCASCHGANAAGTEGIAPPLIHKIYEPSHHADESFQRAVSLGVRAHHWPFGNMPAIEGLTRGDVTMIIAYIRRIAACQWDQLISFQEHKRRRFNMKKAVYTQGVIAIWATTVFGAFPPRGNDPGQSGDPVGTAS